MTSLHPLEHPEVRFFIEGGEILGWTPDEVKSERLCKLRYTHLEQVVDNASLPLGSAEAVADEFQEYHWCVDFALTERGDWFCIEMNFGGIRWNNSEWVNMCGYGDKVAYSPRIIHSPTIRKFPDAAKKLIVVWFLPPYMVSTSDVPRQYIVRLIAGMIEDDRRAEETAADVFVNEPEWMDSTEEWLLDVGDLISEGTLDRQDGLIHIEARDREEDKNYEAEQQNVTGGVYVNLEQEMVVEGELAFREGEEDLPIVDDARTNLQIECMFRTMDGREYSGERPPF